MNEKGRDEPSLGESLEALIGALRSLAALAIADDLAALLVGALGQRAHAGLRACIHHLGRRPRGGINLLVRITAGQLLGFRLHGCACSLCHFTHCLLLLGGFEAASRCCCGVRVRRSSIRRNLKSVVMNPAAAIFAAVAADAMGLGLICPEATGPEAAWAGGARILAPRSLISLVNHFKGTQVLTAPAARVAARFAGDQPRRPQHRDLCRRQVSRCDGPRGCHSKLTAKSMWFRCVAERQQSRQENPLRRLRSVRP